MVDFAVLEVVFNSEDEAKKITNDFYNKYKDKKGINFFADEPTGNRLSENYFFGGYSHNIYRNEGKFVGNFSTDERTAAGLKMKDYKSRKTVEWNRKDQMEWGIWYEMEGGALAEGRGSLVVDSELNLLGVLAQSYSYYKTNAEISVKGYVDPLKFSGIRRDDMDEVMIPKIDLIMGTDGQVGSYKQQLDKYHPNMKTRLRNEWTKGVEGEKK